MAADSLIIPYGNFSERFNLIYSSHAQRTNRISIRHYFKLSSHPNSNTSLSASARLTVIVQVVTKEPDGGAGPREGKQSPLQTPWVQGLAATSHAAPAYVFPTQKQRAEIAISFRRQSLSYIRNARVPDSQNFGFGPASRKFQSTREN